MTTFYLNDLNPNRDRLKFVLHIRKEEDLKKKDDLIKEDNPEKEEKVPFGHV